MNQSQAETPLQRPGETAQAEAPPTPPAPERSASAAAAPEPAELVLHTSPRAVSEMAFKGASPATN